MERWHGSVGNPLLQSYYRDRCFTSQSEVEAFFETAFMHKKRLYFDEVENANVWSFYLVDRDLHHTFEEYIIDNGLEPYATWSKLHSDIGPGTFPIADTTTMYRRPVPKAGQELCYTLEVLALNESAAVFGFLGFLRDADGQISTTPSVASAWQRVFVRFQGEERNVGPIPERVRTILTKSLVG